jgi:hypothetical protein
MGKLDDEYQRLMSRTPKVGKTSLKPRDASDEEAVRFWDAMEKAALSVARKTPSHVLGWAVRRATYDSAWKNTLAEELNRRGHRKLIGED